MAAYNEFYNYTSSDNLRRNFSGIHFSGDETYEKLLKSIRDQVVKYLKVIFITVAEEDEAYTIFETLNARGMDLSFVDLIKNKIFRSFNATHPDDFAKTKWKELRSILSSRDGSGNLETFVRHWWIAKYNYTSADNVYKHFKKLWKNDKIDAESFLIALVNDAFLYTKIASPLAEDFKQQEEQELYKSLLALRIFNISQQRPFILNLFKAYHEKHLSLNQVKETLSFLEKFHFSFNAICSMRPSGIEGSYSKAARQLLEAADKRSAKKVIDELTKQLRARLPDQDSFSEGFIKLRFIKGKTTHKKLIQYIFSYLEAVKQTTTEFKPDSITLEHILPQSSQAGDFVGSVGNLLPLGPELNKKASNKSLSEKVEIYRQSNYSLTQDFVLNIHDNWGKEEIEARASELSKICYESMWGE